MNRLAILSVILFQEHFVSFDLDDHSRILPWRISYDSRNQEASQPRKYAKEISSVSFVLFPSFSPSLQSGMTIYASTRLDELYRVAYLKRKIQLYLKNHSVKVWRSNPLVLLVWIKWENSWYEQAVIRTQCFGWNPIRSPIYQVGFQAKLIHHFH